MSNTLLLLLAAATSCVLNVTLLPDLFPDIKLSTLFIWHSSVILGLYGFWCAFIYPDYHSPLGKLPKLKSGTIPLVGHPAVTFRYRSAGLFHGLVKDVPNEGLIRVPGLFNQNMLIPTNPIALADVLVHNCYDFEKPRELRKFLRIVVGDGLLMAEGDEHGFQRKHSSPAFSFRHIKDLYPIFWQKAAALSRRIIAEVHENPEASFLADTKQAQGVVQINHWASKAAMDIIGIAGLGRDFNTLYSTHDDLIANYEEILEPSMEKAIFLAANLLTSPNFVARLPWKLSRVFRTTMLSLRSSCRQLVKDKKEAVANGKDQHIDILSLLIKSNNFADETLVDTLLTYLAAGHETTSAAFTFGAYILATKPDVQSKLRKEIRTNLPSPSAPTNPNIDIGAILESLPYLHGVCAETLRLYPPVPTTSRVASRDTIIAGYPVPKGTRVYLSPFAINRSADLWDRPEEFVPERWYDLETLKPNNTGGVKNNYSIMTFLHGPRSCIGERFAKSELKALMAVFVGSMKMEMADPDEKIELAGTITLKPKAGLRLRVQALDGW